MNKKYLVELLDNKGLTFQDMAKIMEIKKDSLYRKVAGINGFNLKDIKLILQTVGRTFEDVFLGGNDK